LAGGVVGETGPGTVAEDTRDVDDASASRLKIRQRLLCQQTGADHIDGKDVCDLFYADLGQRENGTGASIVHENVQAPPSTDRTLDGALGVFRLSDICEEAFQVVVNGY